MSFVKRGLRVVALADIQDVLDTDQRIFEQNEGLTDEVLEAALARASERVLNKIQDTSWWRDKFPKPTPALDAARIRARQNDFTDLTVYLALSEIILPRIAEFDTEEESERNKMSYYSAKWNALFNELIANGDWYDFSGSGAITAADIQPGSAERRRVR